MREISQTRFGWTLVIVSTLIALTLAAGGYWFHLREAAALRRHQAAGLKAIADLKTGQLLRWRLERLADVRMNAQGIIRLDLLKWLKSPDDPFQTAIVHEHLRLVADLEGYDNMILAGPEGRLFFSLDSRLTRLDEQTRQLVTQTVAAGTAIIGDFFRCPDCDSIHLDVTAPLLNGEKKTVAVLIQRVNPEHYLFPLLQSWPTPSKSGETLLVRREREKVLFLNMLRHRTDRAMTVSIPLSRTEVPAVRAVLGQTGSFLGLDFRGVAVLSDIRAVPDSPWFLVAKMDDDEVRAEIKFVGQGILLLVGFAILMTGALAAFVFNYRQRHLYQSLFLAERQGREAQEEIRATLYGIGDGVIATDDRGGITRMNPVAEQLTGWKETEALGQPLMRVFRIVNEETRSEIPNPAARVLLEGRIVGLANHTLLIGRDGTEHPIADSGAPIRDEQGAIIGVALVFRDQTEERATRRVLLENESRYRMLFEANPQPLWVRDLGTRRFLAVNEAAVRHYGFTRQEFLQMTEDDLQLPGEPERTSPPEIAVSEIPLGMAIARHRKKTGEPMEVEISSHVIEWQGQKAEIALVHDITARKALEEQLNQAQKMEAIGQLAGGVAHDFNNMLMVIIGHAEIAQARIDETQPLFGNIQEILKAARRSAELTRQLLAFARKQTANPRILNLNDTVAGMLTMLQRLIGEDIALTWKPGPELWAVKIDPTQVDQILANMSVNARDAIVGGGRLTIATENVVLDATYTGTHAGFLPGQYVLLVVSDTGAGMDRLTREHLFEPFFTTKAQGKGTGLGLATVYGIVKQNNGFINVYSEPGQGTTFRIYFPRIPGGWAAEPTAVEKPLVRGVETILLVEDEQAILSLGKDILEQCGYTVLAARLPSEALALAAQHQSPIHLLITDVVMPEMNGREMREKILALRPEVKTLYMSGYTADVIVHHGVVEEGVNFLQKPFSIKDLADKVREVLSQ